MKKHIVILGLMLLLLSSFVSADLYPPGASTDPQDYFLVEDFSKATSGDINGNNVSVGGTGIKTLWAGSTAWDYTSEKLMQSSTNDAAITIGVRDDQENATMEWYMKVGGVASNSFGGINDDTDSYQGCIIAFISGEIKYSTNEAEWTSFTPAIVSKANDWYRIKSTMQETGDFCWVTVYNGTDGTQLGASGRYNQRTPASTGLYAWFRSSTEVNQITNITIYAGDTPPAATPPKTITISSPADSLITNLPQDIIFNLNGTSATNCSLYTTELGSFTAKETIYNILQDTTNQFSSYTFDQGTWLYNVGCYYDSAIYFTTNRTITFDAVYPTFTLNTNNEWNANNNTAQNNYDNEFMFNVTFADDRDLYLTSAVVTKGGTTYFNFTNVTSGLSYTFTNLTDITSWPVGLYNIQLTVSDSHTAKDIKDYQVLKLNNKLKFYTDEKINIEIYTDEAAITNSVKSKDRYSTEFTFIDQKEKARDFHVISDYKIVYLQDSEYQAHFVIWNGESGNWIDFEGVSDRPTVIKVSDYHYIVHFDKIKYNPKFNSVGSLNTKTQGYTWYRGNSNIYTANNLVGEIGSFYLNLSLYTTYTSSAELVYNGTNKNGNTNSATSTGLLYSDTTTNYNAGAAINYYWLVNITRPGTTTLQLQINGTQTVADYLIDNCTVAGKKAIFFEIYNEQILLQHLLPMTQSTITGTYWPTSKTIGYKNITAIYGNVDNLTLCINSSETLYSDLYVNYVSKNGFTHRYYLYNVSLSESSTKQYAIYNFNTTTGISTLRITARDIDTYAFFPGAVVSLERFYPAVNQWRTVQMGITDDYGFVFFNIEEKSTDYRLIFRDESNNILKTTDKLTFSCDSSVCTILALLTDYESIIAAHGVTTTTVFNNNTKILTIGWTSSDIIDMSTLVFKETGRGSTVICNNYQAASSVGTTVCNLTGYTGVISYILNSTLDGTQYFEDSGFIEIPDTKLGDLIGVKEGAFYAFTIMVACAGFGIWSPVATVIAAIFGLIAIFFLGLLPAMTYPFLVLSIIMGVAIALKLRA